MDAKLQEQKAVVADLDLKSLIDLAIVVLVIGVIVVFGGTFLEDMRSEIPVDTYVNGSGSSFTQLNPGV